MLGRESASRLFGTLRKVIAAISDSDAKEQLGAWVKRAQIAYDRRNSVIHAPLVHDRGTKRLYWTRLTHSLQGFGAFHEGVHVPAMQAICEELQALCDDFDVRLTALLIKTLPYTRSSLGHPPS